MTRHVSDIEQSEEAFGTSEDAEAWAERVLEKSNLIPSRRWFDTDDGGFWTEVELKA